MSHPPCIPCDGKQNCKINQQNLHGNKTSSKTDADEINIHSEYMPDRICYWLTWPSPKSNKPCAYQTQCMIRPAYWPNFASLAMKKKCCKMKLKQMDVSVHDCWQAYCLSCFPKLTSISIYVHIHPSRVRRRWVTSQTPPLTSKGNSAQPPALPHCGSAYHSRPAGTSPTVAAKQLAESFV